MHHRKFSPNRIQCGKNFNDLAYFSQPILNVITSYLILLSYSKYILFETDITNILRRKNPDSNIHR